ncbi:pyridoxal-phosphate dependent enzyme [Streptomyces sp. ActVer]|uniref:pyridoxal-phosphate dependent enzyme n=1 Tax=Streptomyces sp. ActVer TaxID=3014558 RepID=UPI002F961EEB
MTVTPTRTAPEPGPAPTPPVHEHITDAMKAPDLLRLSDNVVLARFETLKVYAALGAVRSLLERGTVQPGQTLVDSSSGIYALALATACHRYGLNCHIVASTTVDAAMRAQLEILGATLDQMPPSRDLRLDQERRVRRVRQLLAERPGLHWMRQYHDAVHYTGYREFADLVDRALPDAPLTVVGAVGTGSSTGGLVDPLRERGRAVRLLGCSPSGASPSAARGSATPRRSSRASAARSRSTTSATTSTTRSTGSTSATPWPVPSVCCGNTPCSPACPPVRPTWSQAGRPRTTPSGCTS